MDASTGLNYHVFLRNKLLTSRPKPFPGRYLRHEDPEHPVVCVDRSKQHLQQTRPPLRLTVGKPYRYDSEYKRNGVSSVHDFRTP